MTLPLWTPSRSQIEAATLTHFIDFVKQHAGCVCSDYAALYQWSIDYPEAFWAALWDYCEVIAVARGEPVLQDPDRMPGARFFPQARLNFAENLLARGRADDEVLVFYNEHGLQCRLNRAQLRAQVSRVAQAMQSLGIGQGDRVAAVLPNMPETLIGMLACAAIGAIWSSCSPDFGVHAVLTRFAQIEPKLLLACDGYRYNGQTYPWLDKLTALMAQLPSLRQTVLVPYLNAPSDLSSVIVWNDWVAPYAQREIEYAALPFNHPLYILYSSGTTGAPKCIVHGAGGTLLQHLKEHRLHCDIKPGDRVFYYTTCGWMMWNWLVSALASRAVIMLYDGSPFYPREMTLLDYAEQESISHFGVSAKYIDALRNKNLTPKNTYRLPALRMLLSTGSPLAAESYTYVYREVKADLCLASISGGTDIVSCFALGNPLGSVWPGELQTRGLGMRVEVWDAQGRSLRSGKGELVCAAPFPSMPLGFWNDDGDKKYRAAYFEKFSGVWTHGDYAELTPHDGIMIHGRSDATLNPGGIRIGTAEIYREIEQFEAVQECLAVAQQWRDDVRVILFVVLKPGVCLDDALSAAIRQTIKERLSPRHVPAKIIQVPDVPRTRSGKISELAVREMIHGHEIKNREALANPESLIYFENLSVLQD